MLSLGFNELMAESYHQHFQMYYTKRKILKFWSKFPIWNHFRYWLRSCSGLYHDANHWWPSSVLHLLVTRAKYATVNSKNLLATYLEITFVRNYINLKCIYIYFLKSIVYIKNQNHINASFSLYDKKVSNTVLKITFTTTSRQIDLYIFREMTY